MDVNDTPTKGNLMQIEKTLTLSQSGYHLMDKKRMILVNEIHRLTKKARQVQEELDEAYQEAYRLLDKAAKDISLPTIYHAATAVPIDSDLRLKIRSVMGTAIPETQSRHKKIAPAYSLYDTSVTVDLARLAFAKVNQLQAELAVIENSAYRLARNILKTQKRVNALQNITIPQLQVVHSHITQALEEKEREEFTRLKVVKRILNNKREAMRESL